MNKFLKVLVFSIFLISAIALINNSKADVINPEFYTKKCNPGELEVVCRYISKIPFGPHTYDECSKYENDNNYYYLTDTGSSFGGSQKFCLKSDAKYSLLIKIKTNYFFSLALTIAIEIAVALVLKFKDKTALMIISFVNLITNPVIHFILWLGILTYLIPNQFIILIILELGVIVFEWFFLTLTLHRDAKKLLLLSVVMNSASFLLGLTLLS